VNPLIYLECLTCEASPYEKDASSLLLFLLLLGEAGNGVSATEGMFEYIPFVYSLR
jgi:hypothetical protein